MMRGASVGAMALVLAVAPFVFLNGNFDPANLPQSAWVQAWGLAFMAWALTRVDGLGASAIDLPLAALIAWGALSITWATSRAEAVPVAMHWAACGAWFVAVSRTVSVVAQARVLAIALFASGAAVAVLGLAQHLFAVGLVYQAVPPAATFVNKNIAAQYVVATLPLGLAGLAGWGRPRITPGGAAGALAAIAMAVFLVIATTRSAWVAAAGEVLVLAALIAWPRRPRLVRWLAAASVVLVVCGIAAMALAIRGRSAAAGLASVHHRQAIWRNTAAMVADAPLRGVGLGNHKVHYPPYARRVAVDERMGARAQLDHVHNDPLQLAAETGLVGVGLLAWLMVCAVRTWRTAAEVAGPLAVAWAVAIAGTAIDALFSFPMQRALPPVVLAVGVGSLAGLAGLQPGPARMTARALAAAAAVALVFVVPWQLRAVRADRHVGKMLSAERRGSWLEVRDEATAALSLKPDERHALFALGTAELARRRLPEAQSALRALLEDYPHDLPALGNLAFAHTAAGEDTAALALWDRVLALDPRDHRAHFARGTILERKGDADGALRAFGMAAVHNNREPVYHVRRGQAALRAGLHTEAITAFQTALLLAPRNAAAEKGLAEALAAR